MLGHQRTPVKRHLTLTKLFGSAHGILATCMFCLCLTGMMALHSVSTVLFILACLPYTRKYCKEMY